ncbi:MAG: helix-turn-helix transcriptional regulator [Phycisphaerae bacterium]|nr:helix-turn-helix transcriptional regulator [Phycisphaerae bacterium]
MPKIPHNAISDSTLQLGYIHGGVVMYRPGESLSERVLPDYELVLMIEGDVVYRCDGRDYPAPPGAVILARPGFRESYAWDPRRRTRHAYVHFSIDALPADWPAPERWPIVQVQPDPAIGPILRSVLQRLGGQSPLKPSACVTRLMTAAMTTFLQPRADTSSPWPTPRPAAVQRAIQWMQLVIDTHPGEKISLSDIAAAAAVTEKHLCKLFGKSLGLTPMRAFRMMRLQLSLALLSRSNLTIKEIAARCGFESPYHFSRVFSHRFGHSPSRVRTSLRRGGPPPPSPLPEDLMPRIFW